VKIEVRGKQLLLDGYVNAVGRESRIIPSSRGQFIEKILPGTFDFALKLVDNVDLLFNHDKNRKLGSIKDGNLQLYEDSVGLRAKCTISDSEVIQKAKKGELRGWSFGFICYRDVWKDGPNGIQKREISKLKLIEVSLLDKTPAYNATSINIVGEKREAVEQRVLSFNSTDKYLQKYWLEKEIEILKLRGGIR
jgi:HK97 family phage prohead protease